MMKNKDKDYVPFWWIFLIFLVSFGLGSWINESGAFGRYLEQRKNKKLVKKLARKVKQQNNNE